MNRQQLLELVPHYLAMLVLVAVVVAVVRVGVGELDFWAEFAVVAVVVFLYRPAVRYLGFEPSAWERD